MSDVNSCDVNDDYKRKINMISADDKAYHCKVSFDAYSNDIIDEESNKETKKMEKDTKNLDITNEFERDHDKIPQEQNSNKEINDTVINFKGKEINHDKEIREMVELNKSEKIEEILLSNIEMNENEELDLDELDSLLKNTDVEEINKDGNNVRFEIEGVEEVEIDLEKELIKNEAELSRDLRSHEVYQELPSLGVDTLKIDEKTVQEETMTDKDGIDEKGGNLKTEQEVQRKEPSFDSQLENKEVMEETEKAIGEKFEENENTKRSKSLEIKEINLEEKETNNEVELHKSENRKEEDYKSEENLLNLQAEQAQNITKEQNLDINLDLESLLKINQDNTNQKTSINEEYEKYKDLKAGSVTIDDLVKININYLM